jgi:hypothetical protein
LNRRRLLPGVANLACLSLVVSGCAAASRPGLRAPELAQEHRIARAVERAWTQIDSIVDRGAWQLIDDHFTPEATVVTAAGSVPVARVRDQLSAIRIARVSADPVRQQYCGNGLREMGIYRVNRLGADGYATLGSGPYVVRWVVDDRNVARIDRLVLYGSASLGLSAVPCSPLVSAQFRRAVVFVAPWTNATFTQTKSQMSSTGERLGWVADRASAPSPSVGALSEGGATSLATALVGMRVRVRSHWLELATQVGNNSSTRHLYNPTYQSFVSQTAKASQTYALASTQFHRMRFGAGPTLVSTDWTAKETLFNRLLPPSDLPETVERTRTTRAMGALLQGSFAIDLLYENVLETVVQFRLVPSVHTGSLTVFPGARISQNALMIGASLGHAF